MASPSHGWFLPDASVLFVERGGDLVALDDLGQEQARFRGSGAEALRARLNGGADASPLLRNLALVSPMLKLLDQERALPMTPQTLVGRTGWGQLFVELTARCNERCQHCYAESSPERVEALDRATVEAVVRDAAELGFGVVQFTGGDPLLCSFLTDVCRLARDAGVPFVEVFTNGLLLNDARYAELRDAGAAFAFSLYAATPAVHDTITRVTGSHALTVAAIRRAVAGGSVVRVGVIATQPEHDAEAVAAVELARSLGVPSERVRLQLAHAVGRGEFTERERPAIDAGPSSDDAEPSGETAAGAHALVAGGKAAVLPDGSVTPCIFSRELRLGRVGPAGGLKAALLSPTVEVCDLDDVGGVSESLEACCSALSCVECRLTTALLRAGQGSPVKAATRE